TPGRRVERFAYCAAEQRSGSCARSVARLNFGFFRAHGASPKSSSKNSSGEQDPLARSCCSRVRNSIRRIFPEIVFGNSANSRRRIRLYGARVFREWLKMSRATSGEGKYPAAKTTNAFGTVWRLGCGL